MKKSNVKPLFYLTIASALAAAALRTVSILTAFEADIGYYSRSAVIPHIQKTLIICSVIAIIVLSCILRKKALPTWSPAPNHFSTFASFLCGTLQISSAVLLLLFQRGTIAPITALIILGFFFATGYFFYDALCPPEKKSALCAIPAMAAIIGLVAVIIKVHLDHTVPLNSPNKVLIFITFATIPLFLVQELRFIAGNPQPRLYVATASISRLLCAALSVPGIIGHYTNVLSGGDFLIYYTLTFGYGVYIFVRLFKYVKLCSATEAISEIITENENENSDENAME